MASKAPFERNTAGLAAYAKQKAQATQQRVSDVIDLLLKEGKTVNFNAVATATGVTKSYLYGQPDLRERIDAIRQQQGAARLRVVSGPRETGRTDKSKDILLEAKNRRIAELEAENARLKTELKAALGKLYANV
jgi:S-adenosylmethionine:tRNA-ribosyltransferase-isomerase (queuine synthetase)